MLVSILIKKRAVYALLQLARLSIVVNLEKTMGRVPLEVNSKLTRRQDIGSYSVDVKAKIANHSLFKPTNTESCLIL